MRGCWKNPNDMFPESGKNSCRSQKFILKVAKRALSEGMMKKVDFDDLQSVYLVYNQKRKKRILVLLSKGGGYMIKTLKEITNQLGCHYHTARKTHPIG